MSLEIQSACKVNLLLNILGRRSDGFHELETVMHPVALFDRLSLDHHAGGIELACSTPALPSDSGNLVHRAAEAFLKAAGIHAGVRIHLEKRIPVSAGLGGGSGNAAATLTGLNELFGGPLTSARLGEIAGSLGSDVPFFLQTKPALATGRGEILDPLPAFAALEGKAFLLIHPGFGVSTAWAYRNLARFPSALNGTRGRAQKLVSLLKGGDLMAARNEFYNALEAPVLEKYPLLTLFQEFLRANGAEVARMSGSGSTTFAIMRDQPAAEALVERFRNEFGPTHWTAVVPI